MYKKLEPFIAYLLGAPVKDKQGRVWKRPTFGKAIQKALDPALWGIDVSKWQGIINWTNVKAAGIRYLILRCSYGITRDERFILNIASAMGTFVGWMFGVYHYYDPRFRPADQAKIVLDTLAPYRQHINRIWIDLEFTWSGSFEASKYWKEFAQILINNGYNIGFYTRKTWWDLYVGDLAWWFGQYPLWVAQYSSMLTYIPKGWTEAQLWQDKVGIVAEDFPPNTFQSKEYDHDIAERKFFDTEFGTGTPPPTTGDEMFYLQVYNNDLSYRDRMDYETSQVLGYLKPGDIVKGVLHTGVDDAITQWVEFTEIYKAADDYNTVVVVHAYCSGYTKYMQETTDPNPPPAVPSIFITHEFSDVITLEDGSQYEANFTVENVEYTPKA